MSRGTCGLQLRCGTLAKKIPKLFYCGVECILTHAMEYAGIFEGIITLKGILIHAKEYVSIL